jgi:formylglycine-generating enzyme required for sulfatase activity/transposase-like protein
MGRSTPAPPSDEEKSALVERIIRGELTPDQAQQRHGLSRAELKDWVRVYRREARRAFDDRVKTVLSTQGIDIGELAAAEFSGNVEDMSVAELLQTIQLGEKDAEIRIEVGREISYIWCLRGQVMDAQAGELQGEGAVYRLLSLAEGRIVADFTPVHRPRSIELSTTALLMEGARRFDEGQALRSRLGDMQTVYVPSDRSLAPNVRATVDQFAVLRLFDGLRTAEEVVQQSPMGELETLTCMLALRDASLLERVRPSSTSLRSPPAQPGETFGASFLPTAKSLAAPQRPRRRKTWVWAVAALGSATLGAGLALRYSDLGAAARRAVLSVPEAEPPPPAANVAPTPDPSAPEPHPTDAPPERAPPWVAPAPPVAAPPVAAPAPAAPFALCPEGSVLLGAAPAPGEVITPVPPFCMARAEVTVAEYERCRARGACSPIARDGDLPEARLSPALREHAKQVYANQCNAGQVGRERHPVNCVAHGQASAYCAATGGRLPTEAEWDLAARGSEGRRYPWGDAPPGPTRLNACGSECKSWYSDAQLESVFDGVMYEGDDGFTGTAPVASYPAGATRDGIYDLFGNVAEWTATTVDFGQAQSGAPSAGTFVVRGGSFSSGGDAEGARSLRLYLGADAHGRAIGFRCAFAPKEL